MRCVPGPAVVPAPVRRSTPGSAVAARVLLVEDDRRLGALLVELLTGQGFGVETVHLDHSPGVRAVLSDAL